MSLKRSKAILELGKQLVAQLDANDDLLASWMAHDIAQRIEAAESAPEEEKTAAQDACARAILALWRHRNSLPRHLRPLEELEPVVRTLASLDLDQSDHRYYPQALREAATANADDDTRQWLDLAIGIDYSARLLIQFVLQLAADRAASEAEPWVELALQAGADAGAEATVVRFILESGRDGQAQEDKQAAVLERKLARLESFVELAKLLAGELQTQLSLVRSEKK